MSDPRFHGDLSVTRAVEFSCLRSVGEEAYVVTVMIIPAHQLVNLTLERDVSLSALGFMNCKQKRAQETALKC